MGRISQKLVATFRGQAPPTDQEVEDDVRLFARGLFHNSPLLEQLLEEGYDPLHIKFILGHRFALMFSDSMREHPEFHEYFDIAADVTARFAPDPDETTPITGSFLSLWTLFDLQFGRDLETIGTCLTDVLMALEAEHYVIQLIRCLSESRMGFYQHQGAEGPDVLLRELVTGEQLRCRSTSGHRGRAGELWFVRLGPPLDAGHTYHVTLSTPYVLTETSVDDWTAYLNKSLLNVAADEPRNLRELLKFGKRPLAWHDFIVPAYLYADDHAVFLAGLPDVPSSLPNAQCIELLNEPGRIPGTALAQQKVLLKLTLPQRKALEQLLPELEGKMDVQCRQARVVNLLRLQLLRAEDGSLKVGRDLSAVQQKPVGRLRELAVLDRLRATAHAVYHLRVALEHTDPPVWREIQIHNCTLDELHQLLQAAMGWHGTHPYEFRLSGVQYAVLPENVGSLPAHIGDAESTYLNQVIPLGYRQFSFKYTYDFNDAWEHSICVEGIVPADHRQSYPVCLTGKRACPPEGCGGAKRYAEMLAILADPADEHHGSVAEWLGRFDSESFSAESATRKMRCESP
jgi:hypothetical protein